jgi:hypothetical protein
MSYGCWRNEFESLIDLLGPGDIQLAHIHVNPKEAFGLNYKNRVVLRVSGRLIR